MNGFITPLVNRHVSNLRHEGKYGGVNFRELTIRATFDAQISPQLFAESNPREALDSTLGTLGYPENAREGVNPPRILPG